MYETSGRPASTKRSGHGWQGRMTPARPPGTDFAFFQLFCEKTVLRPHRRLNAILFVKFAKDIACAINRDRFLGRNQILAIPSESRVIAIQKMRLRSIQ